MNEEIIYFTSQKRMCQMNKRVEETPYLERKTIQSVSLAENLGGAAAAEAGTGRG